MLPAPGVLSFKISAGGQEFLARLQGAGITAVAAQGASSLERGRRCELQPLKRKRSRFRQCANVTVTDVWVKGNRVHFGVNAPRDVPMHGEETYECIKDESATLRAHQ